MSIPKLINLIYFHKFELDICDTRSEKKALFSTVPTYVPYKARFLHIM